MRFCVVLGWFTKPHNNATARLTRVLESGLTEAGYLNLCFVTEAGYRFGPVPVRGGPGEATLKAKEGCRVRPPH